jgi:very-short-patch-repair endonuclease
MSTAPRFRRPLRLRAKPSPLERRFWALLVQSGLPLPVPEHPFASDWGRRWRFDFAWPDLRLAVEVDGGIWIPGGGRHNRGAGYEADVEKLNVAVILGWRLLRFTPRHLANGSAVTAIRLCVSNQRRAEGTPVRLVLPDFGAARPVAVAVRPVRLRPPSPPMAPMAPMAPQPRTNPSTTTPIRWGNPVLGRPVVAVPLASVLARAGRVH